MRSRPVLSQRLGRSGASGAPAHSPKPSSFEMAAREAENASFALSASPAGADASPISANDLARSLASEIAFAAPYADERSKRAPARDRPSENGARAGC